MSPLKFFQLMCFLASAYIALASSPAAAWGPQGHRVAGAITWTYLSLEGRAAVATILGDQTLADASTWPDRMRSNPSPFWQETAGPYHYVTVPRGQQYADVAAPAQGDAITALREFSQTLQRPGAALVERQLALRFAVHIIQDLHQPLHVGNGEDRGGTRTWVKLHGKPTNLHRIWDTDILRAGNRSDVGWMRHLHMTGEQLRAAWQPDPEVWIKESAELRDRIYPKRAHLDDEYLQTWLPAVEDRVALAAVRCAAWIEMHLLSDEPG